LFPTRWAHETKIEIGRIKNVERQRKKEEDMMEMVEKKAI